MPNWFWWRAGVKVFVNCPSNLCFKLCSALGSWPLSGNLWMIIEDTSRQAYIARVNSSTGAVISATLIKTPSGSVFNTTNGGVNGLTIDMVTGQFYVSSVAPAAAASRFCWRPKPTRRWSSTSWRTASTVLAGLYPSSSVMNLTLRTLIPPWSLTIFQ